MRVILAFFRSDFNELVSLFKSRGFLPTVLNSTELWDDYHYKEGLDENEDLFDDDVEVILTKNCMKGKEGQIHIAFNDYVIQSLERLVH
jgi:hypothetical protein